MRGRDDTLVRVAPLSKLVPNCAVARMIREEDIKALRAHGRTGRPLGEEEFLATLEQNLGRILDDKSPAPKVSTRPGERGRPKPRVRFAVPGTPTVASVNEPRLQSPTIRARLPCHGFHGSLC